MTGTQRLEVDDLGQRLAQRVVVERVELVGREQSDHQVEQHEGGRGVE